MQFDSSLEWQPILRTGAILVAAVLLAQLAHFFLFRFLHDLARRRSSFTADSVVTHVSRAARLLFLLLSISIVFPQLILALWLAVSLRHALEIGYIVAVAWLAIAFLEVLSARVAHRLPENFQDDVRSRSKLTKVYLLRQIITGLIVFGAFAAALMTFPNIRAIGAGLFASAGLAGLAVGIAARPVLGNLIAGIQIALTEPIRINDFVVVEGESGRVAELNATHVVVRLLDLRHMIVPLSYFIEKPFQNWTRYSSDLIGAVQLYTDFSVPFAPLREEYERILRASPLWDGSVMTLQVTGAKENSIELRFLMSAANPTATFDLRCHVREKVIEYLQQNHPLALPRVRSNVSIVEGPSSSV